MIVWWNRNSFIISIPSLILFSYWMRSGLILFLKNRKVSDFLPVIPKSWSDTFAKTTKVSDFCYVTDLSKYDTN